MYTAEDARREASKKSSDDRIAQELAFLEGRIRYAASHESIIGAQVLMEGELSEGTIAELERRGFEVEKWSEKHYTIKWGLADPEVEPKSRFEREPLV